MLGENLSGQDATEWFFSIISNLGAIIGGIELTGSLVSSGSSGLMIFIKRVISLRSLTEAVRR